MIGKNVGDRVTVEATFKDIAGVIADPTLVVAKAILPDRSTANLVATKLSVGVYSADLELLTSGTYYVKFLGSGAVMAASEDIAIVANSRFA